MKDTIADSLGIAAGGSNDERVRRIQRELAARDDTMFIFDEADHLYSEAQGADALEVRHQLLSHSPSRKHYKMMWKKTLPLMAGFSHFETAPLILLRLILTAASLMKNEA